MFKFWSGVVNFFRDMKEQQEQHHNRVLELKKSRDGGPGIREFIQHFANEGIPDEFLKKAYQRFQKIMAVDDLPVYANDPIGEFPSAADRETCFFFSGLLMDLANDYGIDWGPLSSRRDLDAHIAFCQIMQEFLQSGSGTATGEYQTEVMLGVIKVVQSPNPSVDDWAWDNLKTVESVVRFIHEFGSSSSTNTV